MPSKLVNRREKSAQAVAAAARTHGPLAAETVARVTGHVRGEGEPPPDVARLLELCAAVLEDSIARVVAADEANETELEDELAKLSPEFWEIGVGLVLVLMVLFARGGFIGLVAGRTRHG